MRRIFAAVAVAVLVLLSSFPVFAVQPDEMLADPALEARAREIGKELRCLVCQNESIDESNAELARDLRLLVRERLKEGDSDRQVVDYVVSRYGDFVLLRPPVKPTTWALWFGPPLIFVLGLVALALYYRRRGRQPAPATTPLSAEEQQRLERMLEEPKP
ncbi:MAG: cytochrome c-type biogenesis protein CcmH [Defluviicoccus sp.]|nr:MAG: cytochrome c-type biogenesis protein CcmH [Defluviicoccus sp.]